MAIRKMDSLNIAFGGRYELWRDDKIKKLVQVTGRGLMGECETK
eukprot:CAMPEP_0201672948 /NCGR_PEP_ID=MMETSP0494-20130426/33509_1 /ASSEMBLY_ACC=CAM_ASM_000839 /TAXON_ID=420259 /ORGANISM="Thalassiosira gravida, Strain GMp14c1" /LENGTH=43 /DNA_ID= /DNA_START= /DNA_END= /DNA_ORIENTATION=